MRVLIVDDDEIQLIALKDHLDTFFKSKGIGNDITVVDTEENATKLLNKNKFDIAFFDLHLKNSLEGLELLKTYKNKISYPVILSVYEKGEIIEKGKKAGCKDFLPKPFRPESISFLYNRFLTTVNEESDNQFIFSRYKTVDPYTKSQLLKIPNLRSNKNVVFVNGPTGTGKQVTAEIIYELIQKGKGNFIEENCASIPSGIVESHLFGHKRGSFTGANEDRKGLFELASNGVLFLDEIGKLSFDMQGKLLKVIEQKKFRPVGGEKEIKFNGMIITASCEKLKDMVKAGTFREDLFARISGTVINLRPLKDRKDDILYLVETFIKEHESGRKIEIDSKAKEFLRNYDWRENVREIVKEVDSWQSNGIIVLTEDNLKHLNQKHIETNYDLINEEMINKVQELGIAKYMQALGEEIVRYFYAKNGNKVRQTIRELKTSTRKFYRLFKAQERSQV